MEKKISIIKKIAKGTLRILPNEGRFITTSARRLMVQKELALIKMSRRHSAENLPDPRTVYWIDPMRIELHTSLKTGSSDWEDWVFPQRGRLQTIQDGDWDISDLKVADMRICRAIDARINQDASWASTDYYQAAIRQIDSGRYVWGCVDRSSFDRRCTEIDELIESMSKTGYQESSRLGYAAGIDSSLGHQEIIVNISRDGLPLFQDGRHRLAVARALKIDKIPVQILVRHTEWQTFRTFLQDMAGNSVGPTKNGLLGQNPIHFDLTDIPFESVCEDHWQAMTSNLPEGGGLALDMGCNLGYFCHGLEKMGYSPTGVESRHDIAYAARKIARAEKMTFPIVTGDIFSDEVQAKIGNKEFAAVVAVNILHHLIKTESGFKKLEQFMKNLKCRTMFFEPHAPDQLRIQGGYMNLAPDEFTKMISEWGRFQSIIPIYRANNSRSLFVLNR